MPRVKRGSKRRQKRKKILAQAKGYFLRKSKLYRYAREAVDRSQKFAYIGRRLKKRDFRSLWIIRIGAGARAHGLSYNQFLHGMKLAGIDLNRKMLAELAVKDCGAFKQLVEKAKAAIEAGPGHLALAIPSAAEEPAAAESAPTDMQPAPEAQDKGGEKPAEAKTAESNAASEEDRSKGEETSE